MTTTSGTVRSSLYIGHVRSKISGSAWTVSIVHGVSPKPYRRGGTGYGKGATTKSKSASSLFFASSSSPGKGASSVFFPPRDHSRTQRACLNSTAELDAFRCSSARLGRAPARHRNLFEAALTAESDKGAKLARLAATAQNGDFSFFGPTRFGANNTPSSYERTLSCVWFFSNLPQAAPDRLCDPRNTQANLGGPSERKAYRVYVLM
mmetsp:Transcript_16017/g.67475  ORF Transcript_16017/g.67475 Transcript_16017/m.67475 type:complete len:207 (-) Transcript_16017:1345-1965(-)